MEGVKEMPKDTPIDQALFPAGSFKSAGQKTLLERMQDTIADPLIGPTVKATKDEAKAVAEAADAVKAQDTGKPEVSFDPHWCEASSPGPTRKGSTTRPPRRP